ncbi:MAG: VIT1/CCC1 transporter family protein [Actinobacteria bacterium]|nr:VIT1/CCC1 transporter family protein [Actinomycetota bacterium]
MIERFKEKISTYISKVKTYNRIAGITSIIRRYFALNGFDGVITIIGVLIGNYIIEVRDPVHIIVAGAAVCISLGVSGVWSAYFSESAERKKELDDLEKSTLHDLSHTVISSAQKFASVTIAIANGVFPVITAFIPLFPFFFAGFLPINVCYYIGFFLAFLILFEIGLFLGRVSKTSLIISGIKMVFAGAFCIGLGFLLSLIS